MWACSLEFVDDIRDAAGDLARSVTDGGQTKDNSEDD